MGFGGVALALVALAADSNLTEPNIPSRVPFQPSVAAHQTPTGSQGGLEFLNANEVTVASETVSPVPPTRSSFMATWQGVSGARGYLLDVSTNSSFTSYVDGYHDLDVGNVTGRVVTGLSQGATYYYRVRAYDAIGTTSASSSLITATTSASAGLTIHATFDASITTKPNAAAIEAMINRAVGIYESLFSDPITIQILFRYSTTAPNGAALPAGVLTQSLSVVYSIPWNNFITALRADATTINDNMANASLPGNVLSANITPSSANGRAVGLATAAAMFPDGHVGQGGPYDGIVTINSAQPFQFTRPPSSGNFDAQRSVEHEMDEVLGFGSGLNTKPITRCASSYEAESSDNTVTGGAGIQSCPKCSGGEKVVYVGNNSGTLQFNDVTVNATHNYVVTIWYTNGDAARYALLYVNGDAGTPVSFPSTGSFQTVGSVQRTVTLNAGSGNTLLFADPITGNWAPDFDRIGVNCTSTTNLRPQDLFSWSSPNVRNTRPTGTRYFSINRGTTNIVNFNQSSKGDFGDWLSTACPQALPYVQNAFDCSGQFSDVAATSPEGVNLDVIGYDLVNATTTDINGDGKADLAIYNASTRQTGVWYMNNNVRITAPFGPTLPAGYSLAGVADFNRDGHADYLLFNRTTRQSQIVYLSGATLSSSQVGPTSPGGYQLIGTADFNGDGKPDYLLYNPSTRQTLIWYLNKNAFLSAASGPTLSAGWSVVAP